MATPKTPADPPADDGLVSHTHPETPDEVERFWTEQRRRGAVPVPMPARVPPAGHPPVPPDQDKDRTESL